jgi:hypothetical protein
MDGFDAGWAAVPGGRVGRTRGPGHCHVLPFQDLTENENPADRTGRGFSPLHRHRIDLLSAQCANQFLAISVAQSWAEVKNLIQDVIRLKVSRPTAEVHKSARSNAPLFKKYNANTPTPLHDRLVAAAALRLPRRRPFGTVNALEAFMRSTCVRRALEAFALRHRFGCFRQRFEQRLGSLVRRA